MPAYAMANIQASIRPLHTIRATSVGFSKPAMSRAASQMAVIKQMKRSLARGDEYLGTA